jgi:hypothetical protein
MAKSVQQQSFLRSAEGSIASYDFTDLITGTGNIILDALTLNGSYTFVSNKFKGFSPRGVIHRGPTSPETVVTITTPAFIAPTKINGDVLVSFTYGHIMTTGTHSFQLNGYITIGGVTSAAETTGSVASTTTAAYASTTFCFKNIRQNIRIGDTISFSITREGLNAGFGDVIVGVPMDCLEEQVVLTKDAKTLTFVAATTDLKIALPFKLDL